MPITRAQLYRVLPALPMQIRDRIFRSWQPALRLQILYVLLNAKVPWAIQLGRQLKYFCLTNMAVEETSIVADPSLHIGIGIPQPGSDDHKLIATVLFSRMAALRNRRIGGEINFIHLSATQCRNAFLYLRNNAVLEDTQNTVINLRHCLIDLADLVHFCRGNGEEMSFSTVSFYGDCQIYGGVIQMLQQLPCQHIHYNVYDTFLCRRQNVITLLNTVRRQIPLQTLEIEHCRGPVDPQIMADFIQHNMAAGSTFAIFVDKMAFRATFYQVLAPLYHGPKLNVAFHRNHRTNVWEYRQIGN